MKNSRRVFKKKSQIQNKMIFNANGEEMEFPDVDVNDSPKVGDKIIMDNDSKVSGESLMPNGETYIYANGVLTDIIEAEEEILNTIKRKKDSLNRKIEISGDDKSKPYLKGNSILVDGKELIMGKVNIGNIQLNIFRGKISKVSTL